MPQIKTISVMYERKQNLGDFSSANIGCTIWADVDSDEPLDEVMRALWDMAKANVKAQLMPLVAKQRAEVEHIFLGLPVALQEQVVTNLQHGDGNGHATVAPNGDQDF